MSVAYIKRNKTSNVQYHKLQSNSQNQPKTVRTSSRGNQNFEAARCYKSRKNAVRASSRGNQKLEAARYNKSRKDGNAKNPANLTAVNTKLTNPPLQCKDARRGRPSQQNKHTPYGPHNLPHMVLCTKKGPDND